MTDSQKLEELVALIRRRPGLRKAQLCDALDIDDEPLTQVLALAQLEGQIYSKSTEARNGLMQPEYHATGLPGWQPTGSNAVEQAPSVLSTEVPVPQPTEAAPQPERPKKKSSGRKMSLAATAVAFLKAHGPSTSSQLREAMAIKKGHALNSYLAPSIAAGRILVQDGLYSLAAEGSELIKASSSPARDSVASLDSAPSAGSHSGGGGGLQRLVNHAEMSSKSINEALSISHLPKPAAYLVEHDGEPVPKYLKTDIQNALEKAGIARTEEQQAEHLAELEKAAADETDGSRVPGPALPKKRIEETIAAAYDKYHQAVFSAIRDQLQPTHTAAVYRAMAARIAVAASTGGFYIEISSDVAETYDVDLTQHAEVDRMLEQATDEDVCRLFIEGLLEPGRVWSTEIVNGEFTPDEDDADAISLNTTLFKVARIVGVDTGELKREAFRDIEQPEPAKAVNPADAWPFPKSKE